MNAPLALLLNGNRATVAQALHGRDTALRRTPTGATSPLTAGRNFLYRVTIPLNWTPRHRSFSLIPTAICRPQEHS